MLALKHRTSDAGNFEMPKKKVPYRKARGYLSYSIILELFILLLAVVVHLLLCLIYKFDFVIQMFA